MRAALAALPEDSCFNVIPYTDEPHPWSERLRPARTQEVRKAVAFLEGCAASGKGNVFDAIATALDDPDVDTIVIYTDGAPTGGHRWNLDLMVDLLLEANRHRGVVFDAVLVDAKPAQRKRWERLVHASGGACVEVE